MHLSFIYPSALLCIDVQQGFDAPVFGQRNNPDAEDHIARLLGVWRQLGWPVIHVQHCSTEPTSPFRPELPGCAFKPQALPLDGEPVFRKTVNSAFIGTGLEAYLHEHGIQRLVIVGLTTDHCVSTTTRMAGNLGFDVRLVEEATATFERTDRTGHHYSAQAMHAINLASLDGEFCAVVSIETVLAEVEKYAAQPHSTS